MVTSSRDRERTMRNYSIMLKAALICSVFAAAVTFAGGVRLFAAGDLVVLAYGLMFLVWSIGSAYLTIDSTVKVMDDDTWERFPRSK